MKNCEGKSIVNEYETLYNSLATKGLKARFQKFDNEASNILIQIFQDKNIGFQLMPPNMHQRNASKQYIRTFKKHFMAEFFSVNPKFPS